MPPSRHEVTHAALTDTGVKRPYNQDAFAAQPAPDPTGWTATGHIFVVADGMGGHAVGEKASAKAVRDIPLTFAKHVGPEGAAAAIRRAFTEANQSIFQIGQNNPEFKGLGTTGTALFLRSEGAWVGHVGDSRAYRVRGDRVQQLTFDHSWVWEVAKRQGVDPDELGDFKKNVIIRSLGPDADVEVDVEGPHPVTPGDTFLLCSDGLSNLVPADEIGAVVDSFDPTEAAKFLIELANLRGGPDNITCLIIRVPADHPPASRAIRVGRGGRLAGVGLAVPWPLYALGAGLLAGVAAVGLKASGSDLAVPCLGLAAVSIAVGMAGLVRIAKPKAAAVKMGDDPADANPHLKLHRDYRFALDEKMFERFADLEASLKDVLTGRDIEVDWAEYKRRAEAAAAKAKTGDWRAAFRARCLAVEAMAVPFNKVRHKPESFQPDWIRNTGS